MQRYGFLRAAAIAIASIATAHAQAPAEVTRSHVTPTQWQSSTETVHGEASPKDWGLKTEEWARYQTLMRGPLGIYSPNVDPLTALGIEARSDEERQHYAELQVRAEARRVEKLLVYQRAYDAAWKRLYPTLAPIGALSDGDRSTALATQSAAHTTAADKTSDRLAVFVKDECAACDARVKALQKAGRNFDLYMVGTRGDDAKILAWATRVGIDPGKVRARTITLNHDGGRWLSLNGQGELPAVLREVNGQWQRE